MKKHETYPLEKPIIWIDLEMTGLDITKDTILEIAVVITDSDLNRLIAGPDIALFCTSEVLLQMDEWNQT